MRSHDLSSLRVLASTGEPWNPEPYRWLSEVVGGGRLPIINLSGGTEVGACFLSPTPAIPIKPCSLGGPALGMAVDVFGQDGKSLRGEVGELVCLKPWPAMTRGVWRDPERYLDAYWRRFPGVWTHGDWALVDDDGYWFLYGRSDDTLNIAGKRIGPAEIESALVEHPAVAEAGGGRHSARRQGRSRVVLLRSRTRRAGKPRARRGAHEPGRLGAGQELLARADRLRRGPSEDAERQDRAPRTPRVGDRRGSGRRLVAGGAGGSHQRCRHPGP